MVAKSQVSSTEAEGVSQLPFYTQGIPGIGGELRQSSSDFYVEEIPAYEPSGAGDHVLAWIEKTDVDTFSAVSTLAKALEVKPMEIGYAGMKDKWAVTRQYFSFPPPVTPEQLEGVKIEGISVIRATRHPHKMKTGHLKGNRFRLVVKDLKPGQAHDENANKVLERLSQPPGCPNWYGQQRFGRFGDNASIGKKILLGTFEGRLAPKKKRLFISAYQSALFNRFVCDRVANKTLGTVEAGEILMKGFGGPTFTSDEPTVDQGRLDSGELVVTGPMFGHKVQLASGEPGRRETALLESEGITTNSFGPFGKLARGTRRAASIRIGAPKVTHLNATSIQVEFDLPKGAYATTVMREVMKK